MVEFEDESDEIYQKYAPVGAPHIMMSFNDSKIMESLDILVKTTDGTGLLNESFNVYDVDKRVDEGDTTHIEL
ncbi:hypothetical protein DFQ29_005979 [Apophysomyces sp. BC1021]|nr:hypothetical protein DFQ29_005979 [Apophysomyces sp. BC1021]